MYFVMVVLLSFVLYPVTLLCLVLIDVMCCALWFFFANIISLRFSRPLIYLVCFKTKEDTTTRRITWRMTRRYEDCFDISKLKLPALKTWRPGRFKFLPLDRSVSCHFLFYRQLHIKTYVSKLVWCLYGYLSLSLSTSLSTFCSLSPQTLHWRSYYNGC